MESFKWLELLPQINIVLSELHFLNLYIIKTQVEKYQFPKAQSTKQKLDAIVVTTGP